MVDWTVVLLHFMELWSRKLTTVATHLEVLWQFRCGLWKKGVQPMINTCDISFQRHVQGNSFCSTPSPCTLVWFNVSSEEKSHCLKLYVTPHPNNTVTGLSLEHKAGLRSLIKLIILIFFKLSHRKKSDLKISM